MKIFQLGILLLWVCVGGSAYAQFNPGGALGRLGGGGGGANPFSGSDTTKDTVSVKANLARIQPEAIFLHTTETDTPRVRISRLALWDPSDTIAYTTGGYVQSLGQIGKMYRLWSYGFSEEALLPANAAWRNPLTGRFDRRFFNEKDVRFYDTKTPYVNIVYTQGAKKLQLADITVSRNINAQWNISARHTRTHANGAYNQNQSRTRNMYLGVYYRNKSRRYHGFLYGLYNQLDNQLNGGEYWTIGKQLNDPLAFSKSLATTVLSSATSFSLARNLTFDQYLHLLGNRPDSAERVVRSRLTLHLRLTSESSYQRMSSGAFDNNLLDKHIVPVLPTWDSLAKSMSMAATTGEQLALGGASYQLNAGVFVLRGTAELSYRRISLSQDSSMMYRLSANDSISVLRQQMSEQRLFGELWIPSIKTSTTLGIYQSVSTLYKPQRRIDIGFSTAPQKNIAIRAAAILNNVNPSLFQTYFIPRVGNAFEPDVQLDNQQFSHLRASARWHTAAQFLPASEVRKADSLSGNFIEIGGFIARADKLIFYDRAMRLHQATADENLTWLGLQSSARLRGWRKFYLEAFLTAQRGTSNAQDSSALQYYTRHLPTFYGRGSLYYESRTTKISSHMRTGIDVWFNTDFQGQTVDAVSGEWFPSRYWIHGYPRVDVFFSTKLLKTYFFIKLQNVAEGLGVRGYHTTPTYPMLGRNVVFGVNWSFYD